MPKTSAPQGAHTFTCETCGRSFGMAAHLGRHRAAVHGAPSKTGRKVKKAVSRGKKANLVTRGRRGPGRPPAVVSRYRLRDLTLDELAILIRAARQEADRRLRDYQNMLS